jgi:hypothetical protein
MQLKVPAVAVKSELPRGEKTPDHQEIIEQQPVGLFGYYEIRIANVTEAWLPHETKGQINVSDLLRPLQFSTIRLHSVFAGALAINDVQSNTFRFKQLPELIEKGDPVMR